MTRHDEGQPVGLAQLGQRIQDQGLFALAGTGAEQHLARTDGALPRQAAFDDLDRRLDVELEAARHGHLPGPEGPQALRVSLGLRTDDIDGLGRWPQQCAKTLAATQ